MRLLKLILSNVYATITRWRNRAYDLGLLHSYSSQLPVVSVGNLTVGGNAKTPLVIYIAELLTRHGFSPAVLLRGYGGAECGPYLLGGQETAKQVGDEALFLWQRLQLPIVVARSRVSGAKLIEQRKLADVIILDDGFQHRRLARDVDIVSINTATHDARRTFVGGALLPLGSFREARDIALQRTDMVVFSNRHSKPEPPSQELLNLLPTELNPFQSAVKPRAVVSSVEPESMLEACKVDAFCAIANPDGFFLTLEQMGFIVENRTSFRDHRTFSARDLESLRCKSKGRPLVCTEKDVVKLDPHPDVYVLSVDMHVSPSRVFEEEILRRVGSSVMSTESRVCIRELS